MPLIGASEMGDLEQTSQPMPADADNRINWLTKQPELPRRVPHSLVSLGGTLLSVRRYVVEASARSVCSRGGDVTFPSEGREPLVRISRCDVGEVGCFGG